MNEVDHVTPYHAIRGVAKRAPKDQDQAHAGGGSATMPDKGAHKAQDRQRSNDKEERAAQVRGDPMKEVKPDVGILDIAEVEHGTDKILRWVILELRFGDELRRVIATNKDGQ
jgi:hypothetical protein